MLSSLCRLVCVSTVFAAESAEKSFGNRFAATQVSRLFPSQALALNKVWH
jgi:hypothetical protein